MANSENNEGTSNENLPIERLMKIRGGNRAVVTKIEREANEVIRIRNPMNFEMTAKIEAMVKSLQAKQKLLMALDSEILDKCDIDDVDKEIEETTDTNLKIEEIISKLEQHKKGTVFSETRTEPNITAFEMTSSNRSPRR
eukprot:gene5885-6574_t